MNICDELKISKPFDSPQEELLISFFLTAERLRDYVNRLYQEYGLTMQQYNLLRVLRGSQPCGLSCAEINSRLIQRSPDITRLINRLEQNGFVERKRDENDNRIVRTIILPRGLEILDSVVGTVSKIPDIFHVLTEEECLSSLSMHKKLRTELYVHIPEYFSAAE